MKHVSAILGLIVLLSAIPESFLLAHEKDSYPSQIKTSLPPDYYFGCNPFPIPTEPIGPVLQMQFATDGDEFLLTSWRYPCSEERSYIIFTVSPVEGSTPRICSADIVLVQNGRQSSSHYLTQDPLGDSNPQCGDVVVETSFALVPTYYPDIRFDLEGSLDFYWDLGDNEQQFSMFAYNPDDYDESEFPPDPGLVNDSGLIGLFYDPENPGHGFDISGSQAGLVIYYFGQSASGELLWLVSELYQENIDFNSEFVVPVFYVVGTFGSPRMLAEQWGQLTMTFSDCNTGRATLDGQDGFLEIDITRLVGLEGRRCN